MLYQARGIRSSGRTNLVRASSTTASTTVSSSLARRRFGKGRVREGPKRVKREVGASRPSCSGQRRDPVRHIRAAHTDEDPVDAEGLEPAQLGRDVRWKLVPFPG